MCLTGSTASFRTPPCAYQLLCIALTVWPLLARRDVVGWRACLSVASGASLWCFVEASRVHSTSRVFASCCERRTFSWRSFHASGTDFGVVAALLRAEPGLFFSLHHEAFSGEHCGARCFSLHSTRNMARASFHLSSLVQRALREALDVRSVSGSISSYPLLFFLIILAHSPARLSLSRSLWRWSFLLHVNRR